MPRLRRKSSSASATSSVASSADSTNAAVWALSSGSMATRVSRSSDQSAAIASGGSASEATVTTSRAAPARASWYTKVADSGSRLCASSTTSSRSPASPVRELRAARSSAAGRPMSAPEAGRLIKWRKAPNGMARPGAVPTTQRARPLLPSSDMTCSAGCASSVLPTPCGPTSTTPHRSGLSTAASTCFQTRIAGFYGGCAQRHSSGG